MASHKQPWNYRNYGSAVRDMLDGWTCSYDNNLDPAKLDVMLKRHGRRLYPMEYGWIAAPMRGRPKGGAHRDPGKRRGKHGLARVRKALARKRSRRDPSKPWKRRPAVRQWGVFIDDSPYAWLGDKGQAREAAAEARKRYPKHKVDIRAVSARTFRTGHFYSKKGHGRQKARGWTTKYLHGDRWEYKRDPGRLTAFKRKGKTVMCRQVGRGELKKIDSLIHKAIKGKLPTRRDPARTRNYEYVVYPSTRVEGHGIEIPGTGFKTSHLETAKRVAKEHRGSGIYSVSKGRFVGWINYNGRYVSFR